MKVFTADDVRNGRIPVDIGDLVYSPLSWQLRGLQQTNSGYGAKLTSFHKINYNGRLYRLYQTCYGNCASSWFRCRGRKIFVY